MSSLAPLTTGCLARVRRIGVICSAVLALLVAAHWLNSQFNGVRVERRVGTLVRNTNVPDGQPGAWQHTLEWSMLSTIPHQFRIQHGAYINGMSSNDRSARFKNWHLFTYDRASLQLETSPWFVRDRHRWRILGFGVTGRTGASFRVVYIPYWPLIVMFAMPPLIVVWRCLRTRARSRAGCCIKCNYPLDGGMTTCPECGTVRELSDTSVR